MTYLPVDVLIDQKAKQRHLIDTLNLLAYVSLLVLVLVTTWFFKRRQQAVNKCHLHETGLAIIYGFVMGAGLRYFGLEVTISSIPLADKLPRAAPPDYMTILAHNLGDKNANQTHEYAYEFRGEIQPNAKLGSQISYASVNPEIFFNIILPPIVLNAGLSLKRRHFFRNIGAIFTYAFLGTTVSVASVGLLLYYSIQALKHFANYSYLADQFSLANCLYFGAIISPTDPIAVLAIFQELGVDVNLFALVFGESILNDAVSIVLTHSIDHFSVLYGRDPYYSLWRILYECAYNFLQMFAASCSIGALFGVITALTTKFTKLTESPLLESSLVVLMSYLAFLSAEALDLSGIVAILMCGITQAHYTINNLSFEARERLKTLFELLTFLCENFLFLAVGVCFWQRNQTWDLSFIGLALVAITVARALSVYPLTVLLNLGRRQRIPINYQHLIAWGGAARGVISYSLAARNTVGDARRIMLSTTSVIVIVTVIAVGGAIEPMLRCLGIPFGPDADKQRRRLQQSQAAPATGSSNATLDLNKHLQQQQHFHYQLRQQQHHHYFCCDEEAAAYDTGDETNNYHATNNPAWLVRPKRLASLRWTASSLCSHQHHYRRFVGSSSSVRLAGGVSCDSSVLVLGGHDSLAGPATTPTLFGSRLAAAQAPHFSRTRGQLDHRHQHHNQMSAEQTPVLEIEATNGRSRRRSVGCECMLDSRSISCSSQATTDHRSQQPSVLTEEDSGELAQQHNGALVDGLAEREPSATIDGPQTNGRPPQAGANNMVSASLDTLAGQCAPCAGSAIPMPGGGCASGGGSAASLRTNLDETTQTDGPYENASLVRRWRYIDNYFIKPLLTNSQPTLLDSVPTHFRAIARLFTSDEQLMRHQ